MMTTFSGLRKNAQILEKHQEGFTQKSKSTNIHTAGIRVGLGVIAQPCYRRYKSVRHRGQFIPGMDRRSDHLERFHGR
jgi:hypothetical protein